MNKELHDAVAELRCSLGTIAGLAESNGHNALAEIFRTAHAGLARLNLILPCEPAPKEDAAPCEYFRAKECLSGCPRVACQEAGVCLERRGGTITMTDEDLILSQQRRIEELTKQLKEKSP